LGDGCWGQGARALDDTVPRWYHEKVASIQHFWMVDVSKKRVEYRAINKDGKVFDVYPPDAPGAKEAEKVFLSLTQSQTESALPGAEYHIYNGNTHAHTIYTASHGEQLTSNKRE